MSIFHCTLTMMEVKLGCVDDSVSTQQESISSFRQYLPQVLASSTKNLLVLNVGFAIGLPTVLIPALSGLNPLANPDESLKITNAEASWIASLFSICTFWGCFVTGFLDPLGRKKAMMLCNIPFLFGWILLYNATSLPMIFIAIISFGFGTGLMEAPILNYIGEICEPKIRGILSATTSLSAAIATATVYFLGNKMPWRDGCLMYATIPIIGLFTMLFIPETPQWLLSRNRQNDALKSLQWLRGWVGPDIVQNEFIELQNYRIAKYVCQDCEKQKIACEHPPPKIRERFRDILRRKTLCPLGIVAGQFVLAVFCGTAFRPYFVHVLHTYRSAVDPNTAVIWIGYVGIFANFLLIFVIRSIGKRILYLVSLALAISILFVLGIYGFLCLNNTTNNNILGYLPVVGFSAVYFLNNFAVYTVPALLLAEVFPLRTKALASGLTGAILCFSSFTSAKIFYLLQAAFTLPGQCIFYGCIGIIGFIIMYFVLPETEGRTLEEIETYFSNKKRKFNDIHIPKLCHKNMCKN